METEWYIYMSMPQFTVYSIHLLIQNCISGPEAHPKPPRPGLPAVNRSVLSYVPSGAQDGKPLPVVTDQHKRVEGQAGMASNFQGYWE